MSSSRFLSLPVVLSALVLTACYGSPFPDPNPTLIASPTHAIGTEQFDDLSLLSADELFAVLGQEFQVPSDLLRALAWVETSFASPSSTLDAGGWFGLSAAEYTQAAEITGQSSESLRAGRSGGLLAGAALIDQLRNKIAPSAHPAEADAAWAPVLQAWADLQAPWLRQAFVDEVYAVLQTGLIGSTEDTDTRNEPDIVVIAPRSLPGLAGLQPIPWPLSAHPPDYPAALRLSSPEVSLPESAPVSRIELRLTERSWPQSTARILSGDVDNLAHYLVRRSDGLVAQFVWEDRRLPDSPPGTVVIALAGTVGAPSSLTPQLLEGSARLVAYLSWRHGLPLNSSTVQGQLGDAFPWDRWRETAACFAEGGGASCPIPSAQHVESETPEDDGARSDSVERDAGPIPVPYFYQYANSLHPSASCQNTSIAMVLSWAGWSGNPDQITARFGKDLAQSPAGLVTVFNTLAAEAGLEARIEAKTSGSISGLQALLDSGKPVIIHGYLTSYGHVLVATGYDGSGYYANDPAGQWAQSWKGGYPYGWSASVGRGIRYGRSAFEQAVSTSNGSSYLPLWYYDITGVDTSPSGEPPEPPASGDPTDVDGAGPVGPEEDDEASPYPWAGIEILTPNDGDPMGTSFLARAERSSGKEIQFWSGSLKLADEIIENPGGAHLNLPGEGSRELTARNVSQWGTVLATDRINVILSQDAGDLAVHATALGGPKYLFTSTPTVAGVSYVKYYADTFLLDDDWSGDSLGVGEGYPLTYSFEEAGLRAIEAIGYSASNEVLATGAMSLLVEGTADVASCNIGGSIVCGGTFSGDTSSSLASDVINGYPTIVGNYEGPELGVTWTGGVGGEVEVRLVDPDPTAWDLDILVLDQSSGECVATDVVTRAFTSVTFEATGSAYTFVVDGFAGDSGFFELALDCNP